MMWFVVKGTLALSMSLAAFAAKVETKRGEPVPAVLDMTQLRKVQTSLQSSDWLSVDFAQESYKSLRKKTVRVTGKAYFAKPTFFRWSFLKPVQDEWIYDGKVLLNISPKEQKALRYSTEAKKGNELRRLVDIVLNLDKLLATYKLEKAIRTGNIVTVDLVPSAQDDLVGIKITLDEQLKYISSVKLMLAKGDYSEFKFSNPSFTKITADKFAAPAGIKVTDAI